MNFLCVCVSAVMHSRPHAWPTKICVIFHFILKIIKKKEEEANAKPEARHNRAQLCFAPAVSFTMCSSAFSDLLFVVFSNDINVCPQQQQQKKSV